MKNKMDVPENFKFWCRLCGKYEQVSMDIFGKEGSNRELQNKIETCLPLEVSQNDQLPNNLCYRCLLSLENFYDFYNQTIKSILNLESIVHSSKSSVKSSSPLFGNSRPVNKLVTFDRYTNTEDGVLSVDASTSTEHKTYKDRFTSTEESNGNGTTVKKQSLSLVDYDSDTDSIYSDGKIPDASSNLQRNCEVKILSSERNTTSEKQPTAQDVENSSTTTSNLITEIALRKNLCKKRSADLCETIVTKKRKLIDGETEQNTSRRKNKQPKKIEYGNAELPNVSLCDENPERSVNCLLCDSQFENNNLLARHLYETHGLEPKEIFNPGSIDESNCDRSPKNNKKIPNLVKITDVLLAKSKGHDLIKEETVSSDSEIEAAKRQSALAGNPLFDLMRNSQINFNEAIKEALWNEKQYFADNTQKILQRAQNESKRGSYLCQICARDFNDRASLWLHLRATHPKHASLACGVCLYLCSSWQELREHTQTDHSSHKMTLSEIRKYYCVVCLRQHDSKKKLVNHVYVHDFLADSVESCGRQFDPELFVKVNFGDVNENQNEDGRGGADRNRIGTSAYDGILYSQLVKDEKIEDDIEEVCMQEYDENAEQSAEAQLNTQYLQSEENEEPGSNVYKTPRNYTLTYSCDWCARTLPSKWDRWQHVAAVHAPRMAELVCSLPHCRKVFVTEIMRQEHEAHHQMQGPVPNSCEVCCKLWNTRVDFYKHMMGVHPQAVPLICGVCLKIFSNVPELYSHLQATHLPLVGDFVCNVCGRNYSNKSKMVRHRRIHGVADSGLFLTPQEINVTVDGNECSPRGAFNATSNVNRQAFTHRSKTHGAPIEGAGSKNRDAPKQKPENYICKDCPGAKFTNHDEFSTHKRVSHQIFHCDLCTKYYGRNSHLWKHVNRCHKGNRLITCQICFKTSASKYHLEQHFNKIHALKSDKLKNGESAFEEKVDGYSFESVKQSFLRQETLERKRKLAETAAKRETDDARPRNDKLPKEIDASSRLYASIITNYSPPANRGPHKCVKCNRGFHKRYLLKKHKKNCRPRLQKDLLTRCKTCERIFKDRQSLQKHLANYHSAFKCHLCDVTFASKCEIVSHVRFNHPHHPDFVCDCGRILRSKADLNAHKSDHGNSQICQFCGDSLDSKMKLKMHVLSLHRKILSLSCGICLKLFETQHVLRDHVKLVHFRDSKFGNSCSVCGKKYGSKWKCYDHINKSHGKIFQPCKICLNVFETESEMQEHFKSVHLGLKIETAKESKIDPTQSFCAERGEKVVSDDESPTPTPDAVRAPESKPSIPKITLASNKNIPDNYSIVQKTIDCENYNFDSNERTGFKKTVFQNSSKRTVYENSDDPSMCEICLKTWPAKKHLWQHYIRCHKSIAATICGICLKTNDGYPELRKHLLERHPSLLHGCGFGSNFICKICGRYHNARSKLKLHMAIHVNYNLSLERDIEPVEWIDDNSPENEVGVYENDANLPVDIKRERSDVEDRNSETENYGKERDDVADGEPESKRRREEVCTDSELEEAEMLRQHANIKRSRNLRHSRIKNRDQRFRVERRKNIHFRDRISSNDSNASSDFIGFDKAQIDFSLIKLRQDLAAKTEIYGDETHSDVDGSCIEAEIVTSHKNPTGDANRLDYRRSFENVRTVAGNTSEDCTSNTSDGEFGNEGGNCDMASNAASESEEIVKNEGWRRSDGNLAENEVVVENNCAESDNERIDELFNSDIEDGGNFIIEDVGDNSADEEVADNSADEEVADNSADEEVADNSADEEVADNSADEEVADNSADEEVADNSADEEVAYNSANEECVDNSADEEVVDNSADEEVVDNSADEEVVDNSADEEVADNFAKEEVVDNCVDEEVASAEECNGDDLERDSNEKNIDFSPIETVSDNRSYANEDSVPLSLRDDGEPQFNSECSEVSIVQSYEINLEREMLENMLGENQLCGENTCSNIAKNSNSEIAIESAIKSIEEAVASGIVFVDDETVCANVIEIETNETVMTENEIEIETAIESIL